MHDRANGSFGDSSRLPKVLFEIVSILSIIAPRLDLERRSDRSVNVS